MGVGTHPRSGGGLGTVIHGLSIQRKEFSHNNDERLDMIYVSIYLEMRPRRGSRSIWTCDSEIAVELLHVCDHPTTCAPPGPSTAIPPAQRGAAVFQIL